MGKDKHQLPVFWLYSKKAWRTRTLLLDWFHRCFVSEVRKYLSSKRLPFKVLLTMDNIPWPPKTPGVKPEGIKVIQVPPNNISLVQPLDQMVIKTSKAQYTQSCIERTVNTMEENSNREDIVKVWKDYIIEDAFVVIEKTTKAIKPKTIKSCWRKLCRCCIWLHRIYDRGHQGNQEVVDVAKKRGGAEDKDFKMWILEKFKC